MTAAALDVGTGQNEQNPGTGTDAVNSGAGVTTTDGQYVFGATYDTSHDCSTTNAGTNFTIRDGTGCAPGVAYSESRIQTSAGSMDATLTSVSSSTDYSTIIMTFKAAAATARRGPLMGVYP